MKLNKNLKILLPNQENNVINELQNIFNKYKYEAGVSTEIKCHNSHKMIMEIEELKNFDTTITSTQEDIENEFDTVKDILESKLYNKYSEIFSMSELFSQLKLTSNNANFNTAQFQKTRQNYDLGFDKYNSKSVNGDRYELCKFGNPEIQHE